ncbi:hypothetical protein H4R34_000108 [Dimargaris verticillata]|uniref:glucan endo-1,3-beta-D-glucosidase n=1 Tax=Dimargaris verticillata TaxID=2761393 RepID=A0A9W8EG84_9FUNG|nr:hypothetical protein H4R34_000108 [Dimargaris verticillata]
MRFTTVAVTISFVAAACFQAASDKAILQPHNVIAGMFKGITYSPFSGSGVALQNSEIEKHMTTMCSLTERIRLYSADGDLAAKVFTALNKVCPGMEVIYGLWHDPAQPDRLRQDKKAFLQTMDDDSNRKRVTHVTVGNESVMKAITANGDVAAVVSTITSTIGEVRSHWASRKWGNILVGTVDIDTTYYSHPALVEAVDFVGINIQPKFTDQVFTTGTDAAVWSFSKYGEIVSKLATKKPIVVTEIGYPTKDKTMLRNFVNALLTGASEQGIDYCYFEFKDAGFKSGDEATYGLFDSAGLQPKFQFNTAGQTVKSNIG